MLRGGPGYSWTLIFWDVYFVMLVSWSKKWNENVHHRTFVVSVYVSYEHRTAWNIAHLSIYIRISCGVH